MSEKKNGANIFMRDRNDLNPPLIEYLPKKYQILMSVGIMKLVWEKGKRKKKRSSNLKSCCKKSVD